MIKDQLLHYLESNDLFYDSQHGFRKGHSTTIALLDVAATILESYECGEAVSLTVCDLSTAFDVVSHELCCWPSWADME